MEQFLRSLPRWATIVSICVAGVAMTMRGAWPTPSEMFILPATVACIYGALRATHANARILFAGLWTAVVVFAGISIDPPQQLWPDFRLWWDSAELLFEKHQSPYLLPGATAFPFPTYMVVYASRFGGLLPFESAAWLLVAMQLACVGLLYFFVRGVIVREGLAVGSGYADLLLQGLLLLHPTMLFVLYYGQSGIIAGTLLGGAVWCWRCGKGRLWWHGSAILMNLAWMVKPQLLMATAFFFLSWLHDTWFGKRSGNSAAAIGELLAPWCVGLLSISVPLAFPVYLMAYRDFISVAIHAHTYNAEVSPNNYALASILSKAGMRLLGIPVAQSLPLVATIGAVILVLWNFLSLQHAKGNTPLVFVPWLLASFLWASSAWRFYLTFLMAGLLLLVAYRDERISSGFHLNSFWLASGIGLTMVLSSFAFTLGILILFFLSHELLAEETAAFHDDGNVEKAV